MKKKIRKTKKPLKVPFKWGAFPEELIMRIREHEKTFGSARGIVVSDEVYKEMIKNPFDQRGFRAVEVMGLPVFKKRDLVIWFPEGVK
jgi:hypothetical protein